MNTQVYQDNDLIQAKIDYLKTHTNKPLSYFKSKADILYKQLKSLDIIADDQLKLRLNKAKFGWLLLEPEKRQRKFAFDIIALEHGFSRWNLFKAWVECIERINLSEYFCRKEYFGFTNAWFVTYREAKQHQVTAGGVLLDFRRQYFVTEKSFLTALGFAPDDEDWLAINFDWVKPSKALAKLKIVEKIIDKQQLSVIYSRTNE